MKVKVKVKMTEDALYYIAGEYMVYRVLGGELSMLGWLIVNSNIKDVLTTVEDRIDFVQTLGFYYTALFYDIKWPHKEG